MQDTEFISTDSLAFMITYSFLVWWGLPYKHILEKKFLYSGLSVRVKPNGILINLSKLDVWT